jgi:hypothetical protein
MADVGADMSMEWGTVVWWYGGRLVGWVLVGVGQGTIEVIVLTTEKRVTVQLLIYSDTTLFQIQVLTITGL